MPQHAMTVTPEYKDEGHLMDFNVNNGCNGGSVDATVVEDASGQSHFQYIIEEQDPEAVSFDVDTYIQGLRESIPNLDAMVQFADREDSGLPEGFVKEWNDLLDADLDDMDHFHEMLEQLQDFYNSQSHEEPKSSTDEWFDQFPQEIVDQQIEYIQESSVTHEQADVLASIHSEYNTGSAEDFIIRAGVDLAYGMADPQELISKAVDQFGPAEAFKAYTAIQKRLNQ